MPGTTSHSGGSQWNRWHHVTLALLGGLIAASFMFFLIVVAQTPGLSPPPESAALFIVVTAAGTISYLFLQWRNAIGYPAAMLTGGFVSVILALVATGSYGPVGTRTNPIGPMSYGLIAGAVIIAGGVAWHNADGTEIPATSGPTSE